MSRNDHIKGRHGNAYKPKKKSKKNYPQRTMVLASPERKNIDVLTTMNLKIQSAWAISPLLNDVPLGSGPTNRIGRKIRMKSIQFRYNLLRSGSNGPSQCRIVVIYDRQPDGLTPTAIGVFNDDINISPMSLANSERFQVLIDETSESMQSSSLNISGSRYKKIDLDAVYNSNVGVGACKTGALWCFASTNATFQVGGTPLDLEIFFRTRYIDG